MGSKFRCIRSTPTEMQSINENDFECLASTGVNTPETILQIPDSASGRKLSPGPGPEYWPMLLGPLWLPSPLLLTISGKSVFFLLLLRGSAFMADKSSDLVHGTLDMLILKTLALEPMHGYGIGTRIEQIRRGVFRVNAGSLFVAFQRLQRDGLIKSEWKASENNRRAKYYALTEQGRRKLQSETREWSRQVAAIARILEA